MALINASLNGQRQKQQQQQLTGRAESRYNCDPSTSHLFQKKTHTPQGGQVAHTELAGWVTLSLESNKDIVSVETKTTLKKKNQK